MSHPHDASPHRESPDGTRPAPSATNSDRSLHVGPPPSPKRGPAPDEAGSPTATGHGIHDLFARQVARTPDAIALEFEGDTLSYRALDARADRLARRLRRHGVGPDVRVGIFMERSLLFPLSILATLKAGGAYVPLDPAYPTERLQMMLEEAGAAVLLTQEALADALAAPETCTVLSLDAETIEDDADAGEAPLPPPTKDADLAYVLFTSGSTGRPKGVAMPHGPLVRLIEWQCRRSSLGVGDRTLQFSALSFDVSFQEIFATWCSGGTLVLISEEMRRDAAALLRRIEDRTIRRLFLPFVALQHITEIARAKGLYPPSLREIITAGEQLKTVPSLRTFFRRLPDCSLENQYGPTESHVVTAYRLPADVERWATLPSIGTPIPSARIYLLDDARRPVETGETGELYIGGDCLAREYLHRPEETAERFLPDPFRDTPGARMYRTGDLARSAPDGSLEFLGRADHQVKVRGYRVELGEIEAVLNEHESVRETVVVPDQGRAQGNRRLLALLIPQPEATFDPDALRAHAAARLPDYMVPATFEAVDAFPLTPSGKVDRRRLADRPRTPDAAPERTVVPPRNDLERILVSLWEKALDVRPIGIRNDFVSLGGHSILAAEMLVELSGMVGRELPLSLLADTPTIEALAYKLQSGQDREGWSPLVPIRPEGGKTPLFCVHGGGRHVLRFGVLARLLPEDQPVYGLQWAGLNGQTVPASIPPVAAQYLEQIRTVQPTGPYVLAGHCYGAVVAYEMARLLRAEGETVELVAMMDPAATGENAERPPSAVRELADLLRSGVSARWVLHRARGMLALGTRSAILRSFLGGPPLPAPLRSQLRNTPGIAPMYSLFGRKIPVEAQYRYAGQRMIRGLRRYRPAPLPVPTVLFHRGAQAEFVPPRPRPAEDAPHHSYPIDTEDHDAIVHHPDTVRGLISHLAAAHRRIAAAVPRGEG